MGKIETCKRDCRRSVGIKYKIKPLQKNGAFVSIFSQWFYFAMVAKDLCGERRGSNATLF